MKTELGATVENESAKILSIGFLEKDVGAWVEDITGNDFHIYMSYPLFWKLYREVLVKQGVEVNFDNPQQLCLYGRNIRIREKEFRGTWVTAGKNMPWYIEIAAFPLIEKTEN